MLADKRRISPSSGLHLQRVTLPALMQEVHTFSRRGVWPTMTRTR